MEPAVIMTSSSSSSASGAAKAKPTRVRSGWLPYVLLVLIGLITLAPITSVVVGSFRPMGLPTSSGWTLTHYIDIWSSAHTYRLVLNTLIFSILSTTLALSIAGTIAWLIERTNIYGVGYFRAAILAPMATPPLLLAIGWILLTSPSIGLFTSILQAVFGASAPKIPIYSLAGMVFVQGLIMVPTSFLILAPVMRNMDPSFEEAAKVSGATFRQTLMRVSLPFLTPPILSLVTLLLIYGMLTFDVPAVIGMPGNVMVMSSEIYSLMNPSSGLPDYGKSAAMNSSLLFLLIGAIAVYYNLTANSDRFSTVAGKAYKATRFDLGRWRPYATLAVCVYFAFAVVLPFITLLWVSLTPYFAGMSWDLVPLLSFNSLAKTLTLPRVWHSAINSLLVAFTAAAALTLLSVLSGWTIIRSRLWWIKVLDVLAMVPTAVPHLMMGVALVFIFFSLRAIPIYGTIWVIALGHIIIFLPIGARMVQAGIIQIHKELEEAAIMAGATTRQTLFRIVMPLIRPTIVGLFVWIFVHSFREFSVAVMLQSGRNEVLSTVLYSYWDNGQPEAAAAIAVTMIMALSVAILAGHLLGAKHERN